MDQERLEEPLYQSLETEKGGVEICTAAVGCARNPELREEFQKYLDQTEVPVVTRVLEAFGLELEKDTPGREIVCMKAQTQAMHQAMKQIQRSPS